MIVKGWLLFISFLAISNICSAEGLKTIEVWKNLFTVTNAETVDSNTTFLITRDGVVVVDTQVTPNEAKHVMAEIRKQTNLPILFTINTHYHGDHTFGNQIFEGNGPIIAHESVRKSLFGDSGRDYLEKFQSKNIPRMDETIVTPPNMVFKDEMKIFVGGYSLRLLHVRGHTDGDVFIYIDQLKTLITGDLVSYRKVPSLKDAYVEEWIKAMNLMSDFDAEIYIPGHGAPGGKPVLIAMKHYLLQLKAMVLKQLEDGKSLKEAQDSIRPVLAEKHKGWKNLELLDANIERAYLEFSLE